MSDEQLRRELGELLLRAIAAQPDTPPEMASLLGQMTGPEIAGPQVRLSRRFRR